MGPAAIRYLELIEERGWTAVANQKRHADLVAELAGLLARMTEDEQLQVNERLSAMAHVT